MKSSVFAGWVMALVGLAGWAVAQEQPRPQSSAPAKPALAASTASADKSQVSSQYQIIGYLEKRDRVVTIKSAPGGTVYSVSTKDGKVLLENLSAEQLRAQAPEIHELIKNAVAGNPSGGHGGSDARLRVSALR